MRRPPLHVVVVAEPKCRPSAVRSFIGLGAACADHASPVPVIETPFNGDDGKNRNL
jgi:hypothetical protein